MVLQQEPLPTRGTHSGAVQHHIWLSYGGALLRDVAIRSQGIHLEDDSLPHTIRCIIISSLPIIVTRT